MVEKDTTERRVYNLPTDLLQRLRAYGAEIGVTSETEVARRLLDEALQLRDDVPSILKQLKARFKEERDLRMLAKDILTAHSLVRTVKFEDTSAVMFGLTTGEWGKLQKNGETFTGESNSENWYPYPPPPPPNHKTRNATLSREPAKGGDLDDDIPF